MAPVGCCSSVDLYVPTILWPWVQIPSKYTILYLHDKIDAIPICYWIVNSEHRHLMK